MQERLEFANVLRGIAAIIVVIFEHFGITFFLSPVAVSSLVHIPLREVIDPPSFFLAIYDFGISGGSLGVALFFLISGFVIPFSLIHYNKKQFLLARLFRIWPTYVVGLIITLFALKFSTEYYHVDWPYSLSHMLYQVGLVRDIAWLESIDGVSWTLEIEIKFYILSAIVFFTIFKKMELKRLLIISIFGMLLLIMIGEIYDDIASRGYQIMYVLQMNIIFITFMLIGVLFNFHHREGISSKVLLLTIILLFCIFTLNWKFSVINAGYLKGVFNYGLALIIFTLFYKYRKYIKSNNILGFFADISYPLYIVHPIVGYVTMTIYLDHFPKEKLFAIFIAFSLSVLIAYLLHTFIEVKSNKLGKNLAKRLEK